MADGKRKTKPPVEEEGSETKISKTKLLLGLREELSKLKTALEEERREREKITEWLGGVLRPTLQRMHESFKSMKENVDTEAARFEKLMQWIKTNLGPNLEALDKRIEAHIRSAGHSGGEITAHPEPKPLRSPASTTKPKPPMTNVKDSQFTEEEKPPHVITPVPLVGVLSLAKQAEALKEATEKQNKGSPADQPGSRHSREMDSERQAEHKENHTTADAGETQTAEATEESAGESDDFSSSKEAQRREEMARQALLRSNKKSALEEKKKEQEALQKERTERWQKKLAEKRANKTAEDTRTADPAQSPSPKPSTATAAAPLGAAKCHACGKTVFITERVSADGVVFHKSCFRCAFCHLVIKPGNYARNNDVYYCKPHYHQLFAMKGRISDSEQGGTVSIKGTEQPPAEHDPKEEEEEEEEERSE